MTGQTTTLPGSSIPVSPVTPRHPLGRGTLGRRLALRVVAIVALVTAALSLFSFLALREILMDQADRQLQQIISRWDRLPGTSQTGTQPPRDKVPLTVPVGGIVVTTTSAGVSSVVVTEAGYGSLTAAALTELSSQIASNPACSSDSGYARCSIRLQGMDYRFAVGSTDTAQVWAGVGMWEVDSTLRTILWLEVILAGVAIGAAVLMTGYVVGHNLRPLQEVARVANDVSNRELDTGEVDLSLRVSPSTRSAGSEVAMVGEAFNHMLTNVEGALATRQASETKVRQFVADASHELRNPLAAIRGYAELTRRGRDDLPPDTRFAISRIESESERMSRLVEDMLLLARLDNGPVVAKTSVDLTEVMLNAVADARAAGQDHTWLLDVPDHPVIVMADRYRIQQVITNLLANARTHTPAGSRVTAGMSTEPGWVLMSVTDDGPGISPEVLPRVFERFVRADSARTRKQGAVQSTGLGLAIVSAVVRAHGGDVRVESRPGRTVFTVRLPA